MEIDKIGIVGLGMLGRGIATCLLGHGFRVVAYARSEEEHLEARQQIANGIEDLVTFAGFDSSLRGEWAEQYEQARRYAALEGCQFVIESVVEDLAVKSTVLDSIETVVDRSTPIASNTSALPIKLMQNNRRHPDRIIGMHWAEPAHASRFMELIPGEETSEETLRAAKTLARRLGKDPVVVQRDVPGFIANRIGYAMFREALYLLQEGVGDAETIDRSFRNAFGLWATFCGPLRWMDLTGGPQLYARVMASLLGDLSRTTEVPPALQKLADQGDRGIANGRGFFEYSEQESSEWIEQFHRHVWSVREILNEYEPLPAAVTL